MEMPVRRSGETADLSELRGICAARERELRLNASRIGQLERRLADGRARLRELDIELAGARGEVGRKLEDLQKLFEHGRRLQAALVPAAQDELAPIVAGEEARDQAREDVDLKGDEMNVPRLITTLERAIAALDARASERAAWEASVEGLVEELHAADARRRSLEGEVERLEAELATVKRLVERHSSESVELKERLEFAEHRQQELEMEIHQRDRDLELARLEWDRGARELEEIQGDFDDARRRHAQELEQLMGERQLLADCVTRIAESRSWRYGHAVSRVLRRALFRPPVKSRSALDLMQATLSGRPGLPVASERDQQPPLLSGSG